MIYLSADMCTMQLAHAHPCNVLHSRSKLIITVNIHMYLYKKGMLLVGSLLAWEVQHTCTQVSLETIHLPNGGGYTLSHAPQKHLYLCILGEGDVNKGLGCGVDHIE